MTEVAVTGVTRVTGATPCKIAVMQQDALVPNAIVKGAKALAKNKGLELVFLETYRTSPEDFSDLLNEVRAVKPHVLVASSIRFDDLLAITRKMKELNIDVPMFSAVPYGLLPNYYTQLGKDAEFVYSGSFGTPPFRIPAISSSSQRTRKSSATFRRYNRRPGTPGASSLSTRLNEPKAWTPTSCVRRC